ncbi:acetate/propionate family kinase [Pediococcus ethanolidurans]|uniref:acetate/propionate family kinase n=1 Tax=Pediococcus ethanolidurans TaxID=319653 RepID=UPI0021AA8ACB|nr:acetate kinase [Pediococcus ethanolidurans]MCT4398241.1 acetate kinase [Pediococcus ethanolidurans]MCV3314981.1 acetate kinase [Pediococcus ethanolidurans]MCV3323579.1 acetate kinase [Pediococcus ethanolidurans]
MEKTIAINAGSSSFKFKLFEMPSEKVLASGQVDRIGIDGSTFTIIYGDQQNIRIEKPVKNHEVAMNIVLNALIDLKIIRSYDEITGVGHRVVAGGEIFKGSVLITEKVIKQIESLSEYAPLHNPANVLGIRAMQKVLPNVTSVAVFDTSFHETLPPKNYLYSIPYEYYEKYGARKYGAHGTSHQFVALDAAKLLGKPLSSLKMITLHLGAGSSIDAILNGQSYDTSMGFTPVSGITMATRSGDIDVSLVNYLMEKLKITDFSEMIKILNTKSGLLGISGISSDMRDVLEARHKSRRAELAVEIFVNNIVKYIGAYIAEMHGIDALVFTAGIGENGMLVRKMIVDELDYFGLKIDDERNQVQGELRDISASDSKAKVLVVPTNEELAIAREVERFKQENKD